MKPFDLPLESARTFVPGAGGVSFVANLAGECIAGYITRAALESYFGACADAPREDAQAALRPFDAHVRLIHQMARKLHRDQSAGAPAVLLTVDTVFRALTGR
jgi:hypothetical protein